MLDQIFDAALLANSADNKLVIFFSYLPQETGFDISCKLSPMETICMQCQILFPGKKNKKNISKCRLLKFLPRVLSVNSHLEFELISRINTYLVCKQIIINYQLG